MADNSTTNNPSLPTDYVSILDLRDRWLKKQHEEEDRIEKTKRDNDKGKAQVTEDCQYVTIVDLRDRWLKKQQQKQHEEEDRIEKSKKDKEKGKAQVTVDCHFDGNSDKNNPQFRNPNPNLIRERGFRRNSKERAQVTVDCQVGGNSDENNPQFRNPNPNLIRERGFRRNPKWSNIRPIQRGFHGGEKISTHNQAVEASNSSETSVGVETEAESVDNGGQLKDAPLMSKDEKKKLKTIIWMKKRKECKQTAKKEGENKEMIKRNVSRIGAIGEKTKEIEAKKKEINVSKTEGIGEKTKEIVTKRKEINVSKIGGVVEKTREIKSKKKKINVPKIGGVVEKTREIESKKKEINVQKIGGVVEKTREIESKRKKINVSKIEKTREIEAKMKEMTVTEECSPGKEKEVLMVAKTVPVWKSVGEVRLGDRRAKMSRRMEVYGRGRRGFNGWNEPRWGNCGEGNRGDKCGLIWVKKVDGVEKVNNGCVVEDGADQVN